MQVITVIATRLCARHLILTILVTISFCTIRPSCVAAEADSSQSKRENLGSGVGTTQTSPAIVADQAAPAGAEKAPTVQPISPIFALVPVSALDRFETEKNSAQIWTDWSAAILGTLAWPLAAILVLWRLFAEPEVRILFIKALKGASQISIAGFEIKLNEKAEATLEDLRKLIGQVPATHSDWVEKSHLETQFYHVISRLRSYLCESNSVFLAPLSMEDFRKFRFTLHVPDVLLAQSMRQLVDYWGFDKGGAGRIFSNRRGIVGLAWRLERSEYECVTYTEEQLVSNWGMTRAEANDTKSTHKDTLLAFLIKDTRGLPIAVLYGDAEKSELFNSALNGIRPNDKTFGLLEAHLLKSCADCGLAQSLSELERTRVSVTQVDIYKH